MKHVRKRLSYANVTSSIALFLALGGGAAAVAASQLPANSVGPRQLQANAVQTGFIARNAVKTGKIAPEAVRAGKLATDAVPTNRLRDNAVTAPKIAANGVIAAKIAGGAVTAGKLGKVNTRTVSGSVAANGVGTFTITCQPGEVLLSGGADWARKTPTQILQIAESSSSAPNTWRVTGNNPSAEATTLNVHAYCLEG